jgi:hypothetical protein
VRYAIDGRHAYAGRPRLQVCYDEKTPSLRAQTTQSSKPYRKNRIASSLSILAMT